MDQLKSPFDPVSPDLKAKLIAEFLKFPRPFQVALMKKPEVLSSMERLHFFHRRVLLCTCSGLPTPPLHRVSDSKSKIVGIYDSLFVFLAFVLKSF